MPNYQRFLWSPIALLIMGLFSYHSIFAIDLADAFHVLTSSTRQGVYHAQVRGYMTAGGYNVHFPASSVQLITMSPPTYSGGCDGIDLFLGGMSYISGEQFVNLLKGIAANTMGYSFSLALRTLCPVCSTVVSDLQRAAQAANKLAIDQCQFSMGMVESLTDNQARFKADHEGAMAGSHSGQFSDFLSGLSAVSNDAEKSLDALSRAINKINDMGQRDQAAQASQYGSSTWKLLNGLTFSQKVFIQSVAGTTARYPYPLEHPKTIVVEPIAASMNTKQLAELFMYGVRAINPNNSELVVNSCANTDDRGNIFSSRGENICEIVVKRKIKQTRWYRETQANVHSLSMTDYGFFGLTYALLSQALANIAASKPLGSPEQISLPQSIYGHQVPISAAFTESEISGFISLAPVPLYRALNIAAVYPSMAEALVHNIAQLVAAHYAATYIKDNLLNITESGNAQSGLRGLSFSQLQTIRTALNTMHTTLSQEVQLLLTEMQATEVWTNQVNQVQSLLYAQTLKNGLDENVNFSANLSAAGY